MKAKRFISTLLVLILIVSTISAVGIVYADAASNPYFTNKKSDSITHNTAHVHAYVKNPGKYSLIEAGCIVKTKSGSWSKTFVDKGFNLKGEINLDYYIGVKGTAKGTKLSPNTAYTYQFYVKAKGQSKTFYSGVCDFTTKADPSKPTFSSLSHSNVTYNNAKVSVHVNNPKGVKITEVGVKIYSTNGEFSKTLSEKQNLTKGFDLYYLMSSNKVAKVTLIAQRTYKYQFYIKANGYGTLKSGTGTFTTPKKSVYTPIKALPVSRIVQPANDKKGSCYLSSLATVVTYKNKVARTGGKDFSQNCKVYKEVYKKNGNTTYVYNSTCSYYGLKYVSGGSLQTIYNNLKAGKPVVVYTGAHASVVIGYNGNSSSLSASNFIVMEIKDGCIYKGKLYDKGRWDNSTANFKKANSPSTNYSSSSTCYVTLSSWMNTNGKIKNLLVY